MKISKKTRSLMVASAGASALLACVTAQAQVHQSLYPKMTPAPKNLTLPPEARVAPQVVVPGPVAPKAALSPVVLTSIFKAADLNKDGMLSPLEFQRAYRKIVDASNPKVAPKPHVIDPLANGCPGCGLG